MILPQAAGMISRSCSVRTGFSDSSLMNTRPLRWGMVGGGEGAFIGAVHRMAARLDAHFDLLAAAPSSNRERAQRSGAVLRLPADRVYASVEEMIAAEKKRNEGIEVVSIVTPNILHFG